MNTEFEALRNAIVQWQARRMALVGFSVAILTAFLGLSKTFSSSIPWPLISLLLLLFISVICYLSAYCGMASKKIGAYIEVVIERNSPDFNWETLNSKFRQNFKKVCGREIRDLNKMLANI